MAVDGMAVPSRRSTPADSHLLRGDVDDTEEEPSVDWAAVRAEYETGEETLAVIAARHGITPSALSWRAKKQLWLSRYRTGNVDRPQIIKRMFRVLELQVLALEGNMEKTGEKEVAVLGKLASTLEKLIDIDNAATAAARPRAQRKDIEELRNKLAQRIAQLKRV
jgi:hypothetical protein